MYKLKLLVFLLIILTSCQAQVQKEDIITGAARFEEYLPSLEGKSVGLVANHSSLVENQHLADVLLLKGVDLVKIFSPEHGFRGNAEAGELIDGGKDPVTGLQVVSLYGSHRKPTAGDLKGIDVLLFDIQDVGTRFYTYISTLHYVLEACAENDIPVIVLDRPNPNGNYVDGPVLDTAHRSFVGMHPVPVVHGMTIGEYAMMINGEKWLKDGILCELKVTRCKNYNHQMKYDPPVPPSPNLPNYQAIRLYPSLCFFEGTVVSIGRGTDFPFQVYGHPEFSDCCFSFVPESRPGFAANPKLMGLQCCGYDLRKYPSGPDEISTLHLDWLIQAYRMFSEKDKFFTPYFTLLAGTDRLRSEIESGMESNAIIEGWKKDLERFHSIRRKYLLYE